MSAIVIQGSHASGDATVWQVTDGADTFGIAVTRATSQRIEPIQLSDYVTCRACLFVGDPVSMQSILHQHAAGSKAVLEPSGKIKEPDTRNWAQCWLDGEVWS